MRPLSEFEQKIIQRFIELERSSEDTVIRLTSVANEDLFPDLRLDVFPHSKHKPVIYLEDRDEQGREYRYYQAWQRVITLVELLDYLVAESYLVFVHKKSDFENHSLGNTELSNKVWDERDMLSSHDDKLDFYTEGYFFLTQRLKDEAERNFHSNEEYHFLEIENRLEEQIAVTHATQKSNRNFFILALVALLLTAVFQLANTVLPLVMGTGGAMASGPGDEAGVEINTSKPIQVEVTSDEVQKMIDKRFDGLVGTVDSMVQAREDARTERIKAYNRSLRNQRQGGGE